MPEGDTVWLAAHRMHSALAIRVLCTTDFRVPAYATVDLSGRRVLEVVSHGKRMLTRIEGGLSLHTHFRMDGTWQLLRAGARWAGGPAYAIRVVLANNEWQALGFRLHDVVLLPTAQEHTVVGHLGPDLLGADWDPARAAANVAADPNRTIAEALLDQRNLAGIGNVYSNETLFLSGVTPFTPVADIDDVGRMVARARRLMWANREHPEQSTTGDRRPGRQHWVYRRSGRPCLRCDTTIRFAELGARPRARTTFWCPNCQAGPAG